MRDSVLDGIAEIRRQLAEDDVRRKRSQKVWTRVCLAIVAGMLVTFTYLSVKVSDNARAIESLVSRVEGEADG